MVDDIDTQTEKVLEPIQLYNLEESVVFPEAEIPVNQTTKGIFIFACV